MKPRDLFTNNFRVPALLMILVVAIMTGFSEGLHEREIIFPEITALASGMILLPRRPWRTDSFRTVFFITLCAVCGTAIVRFLPFPLLAQILTAYLIGQTILGISGTTLAPMISAIALPVLLQSGSLVYPVSAFLLTLLVVMVRKMLVRTGKREPVPFQPAPRIDRRGAVQTMKRELLVLMIGMLCIPAGWKFCIAPPLLVAFQEFTNPDAPARRRPVRAVILIFLCAAAGTGGRLLLCQQFHLPLTLCSIIVTAAVILLFSAFGMVLPPAGALGILPLLIPAAALPYFPLQILTGAAVLMTLALLFFRGQKVSA